MSAKKTSPNYSVPALEKGLDVLEILSTTSDPLSLSQISELSGKSTSELFRTLNCLVERGYVAKEGVSGKYMLTLKLFELSHRHSPVDHLLSVSEKPMEHCAAILGESCHICVLRHNKIQVIVQHHPRRRVSISLSIGSLFPAIRSVSGRLLYSVMNDTAIETLLNDCEVYQNMPQDERDMHWEKIQTIRRTGVSTAVDESYIGLHDTAILIGNPSVGLTASLAVTQLTATHQQRDPQEVIQALRSTAQEINEIAGLSAIETII